MIVLLDEIKERNLTVSYCARMIGIPKRTMQYIFDHKFNGKEDEERKVKKIIAHHDKLVLILNEK